MVLIRLRASGRPQEVPTQRVFPEMCFHKQGATCHVQGSRWKSKAISQVDLL